MASTASRFRNGNKKEQIVQALLEREETGDIQIDEGVLLPHIENQLVKATKVIILPLEQRIANWNPAIQQVELILRYFWHRKKNRNQASNSKLHAPTSR